ncbi:N-carbamoyl-L-amino acid hydrolase [Roseovarius albus]|uniref:N-carbamoyl-L-amino acid hydrolase n=1 Tax=Roseovarius albus TaxID=1247867 RepID=A0A1X6Y7C8_9RHOB|nr:Zn-dependent hydrolase [Roseovarius albus]SLN12425.1 N-carbamoyl-L-amino acid hydrolase [Roseovarius albus]
MTNTPRIDGARLWDTIMEMAKIDALPGGGCGRLTLTDGDRESRELFAHWCRNAGCTVHFDQLGNMFARRPGRDDSLPPIAIGSHLDTQPHGGKFDGVYGVLAGLEIIRTLNDLGLETDAPIEVVNWTNEEGARFAPAMLCSGVYAGLFDLNFALSRTDAEGKTFGDELERIGYAGEEPCGEHVMGVFLEAHIEQGPILEAHDEMIGVVSGGQGQRWYDVTVSGRDAHSGSTPMAGRKDALIAASKLVLVVQQIALDNAPHSVGTVGEMHVMPNSRNTIPGEVRFTIDFRNPDDAVLTKMDAALRAAVAQETEAQINLDMIWHNPPVHFDQACVDAIQNAADAAGYPNRTMVSGAGHDACQVARKVPTAMVFVPCKDGLSHNEAESAEPEHLEAGCNTLLGAALHLSSASNHPTVRQELTEAAQ